MSRPSRTFSARISPWQWATASTVLAWCVWFALLLKIPSMEPSLALQIPAVCGGILLLSVIVLCATKLNVTRFWRVIMMFGGLSALIAAWAFKLGEPWHFCVWAIAIVSTSLSVGTWLGNHLERPAHLLPLCVALSLADIYSVYQGPSKHAAEQILSFQEQAAGALAKGGEAALHQLRAPLANYFVVHLPAPGTGLAVPVLGIGDFVVLAFLLRAAWLHALRPVEVMLASLAGTFIALSLSSLQGEALPALPFIAATCLGWLFFREPRMRLIRRQEVLLTVGVAALFSMLLILKFVR